MNRSVSSTRVSRPSGRTARSAGRCSTSPLRRPSSASSASWVRPLPPRSGSNRSGSSSSSCRSVSASSAASSACAGSAAACPAAGRPKRAWSVSGRSRSGSRSSGPCSEATSAGDPGRGRTRLPGGHGLRGHDGIGADRAVRAHAGSGPRPRVRGACLDRQRCQPPADPDRRAPCRQDLCLAGPRRSSGRPSSQRALLRPACSGRRSPVTSRRTSPRRGPAVPSA